MRIAQRFARIPRAPRPYLRVNVSHDERWSTAVVSPACVWGGLSPLAMMKAEHGEPIVASGFCEPDPLTA